MSFRPDIPSGIFDDAIRYFWDQRSRQAARARGGEGQGRNVRGGMHLDEVQAAIVSLMIDRGVPAGDIFSNCALHKTGKLELPGFFRPTKQWDLLVVRKGRLLAAMEMKAQVGPSFGNNFNNRTEEAMGSALDLWTAYREKAFLASPQPWLGYLFLLEKHQKSTVPVRNPQPHFEVLEEFHGASYAKRYELFCRKLVLERTYSSACFLMSRNPESQLSPKDGNILWKNNRRQQARMPEEREEANEPIYIEPSVDLNVHQFLSSMLRAVGPDLDPWSIRKCQLAEHMGHLVIRGFVGSLRK